jgi:hypothetical protein
VENVCIFSKDRKFRYSLFHTWDSRRPSIAWIALNPSTADENKLDPTLTRIKGFSESFGFGSFYMLNLFAYRATDPKDMFKQVAKGSLNKMAAVGELNDFYIQGVVEKLDYIVLAWGSHGSYLDRDKDVLAYLPMHNCYALKSNADGHPSHPLYLRKDLGLTKYENLVENR